MLGLLIFIVIVGLAVTAWKMRVSLLAKLTGQSEGRIDRRLNRRRD